MKQNFVLLWTAALSLCCAPASGAGKAHATGVGLAVSHTFDTTVVAFAFSAQGGPNGASGHITLQWPETGEQIIANVTCLEVVDNEAIITAEVVRHRRPDAAQNSTHIVIRVVDNAELESEADGLVGDFLDLGDAVCGETAYLPLSILAGHIKVTSR